MSAGGKKIQVFICGLKGDEAKLLKLSTTERRSDDESSQEGPLECLVVQARTCKHPLRGEDAEKTSIMNSTRRRSSKAFASFNFFLLTSGPPK